MFSIRSKLYTYIILILLIPITTLGFLTLHEADKAIKGLIYKQLEVSLTNTIEKSKTKFENLVQTIEEKSMIRQAFNYYLKTEILNKLNNGTTYFFVIDDKGNYINENRKRFGGNIKYSQSTTLQDIGKMMLSEKQGTGSFYDNSGLNFVYFMTFSPETTETDNIPRWHFAAVTPADQVMKASNKIVKVFVFTGFISIFIAFIIGMILIKTTIINNINKLIIAMENVTDGSLNTSVTIKSQDELGYIGSTFNIMTQEIASSRKKIAIQERLRSEITIAEKIQTSLIPEDPANEYYDISSIMIPAEDIGGDYYDFIKESDNLWIGLGDVSGHGYKSGLIMMMAQTALTSIVKSNPNIDTKQAYLLVNELLFNNIQKRMKETNYMTLVLLDINISGKVKYSGAHLDMLLYRANDNKIEIIKTKGIWSAILDDISDKIEEKEFIINKDDILLLFTDGLVEGMDARLNQFGINRIKETILHHHDKNATDIKNILLKDFFSFIAKQRDDLTFIVMKKKQ